LIQYNVYLDIIIILNMY